MTDNYFIIAIMIIAVVLFFVSNKAIVWTLMLLAIGLIALGLASGYGVLPEWQG